MQVHWRAVLNRRYPGLVTRGRCLRREDAQTGEDILLETVKCYGYKDLPQAQQQLKNGFDD